MTTRYKSRPNNSSPWLYENNSRSNAWFGSGPAQHAMIGQSSYGAEDTIAKLLITVGAGDGSTSLLAFKRGNTQLGRLYMNDDGGMMFGSTNNILGTNANAVGRQVSAYGTSSVAFGSVASALGDTSTAVGSNVTAGNTGSIAIGTSTNASADNAIAIGNSAYTKGTGTLAIGYNANIEYGEGKTRDSSGRSDGSVVIGANASSVLYDGRTSKNVVVIGNGAKADAPLQLNGDGVIAIGENARAKQEGAIALGKGAEADGYYAGGKLAYASAIAIGTSAKSYRPRSIAIGNEATITSSQLGDSIAIGTNATVASSYGSDIAIGTKSNANGGSDSIALGSYANNSTSKETNYWNTSGDYRTAQNETFSAGDSSIAIGLQSYAKGYKSIAIGAYDGLSLGGTAGVKNFAPYSGGTKSIAIGSPAQAVGSSGIAIGTGSRAVGTNSIVIGANSATGAQDTVAIGREARANHEHSIAIGEGASTTDHNQIVLGTSSDNVYIPGNLIVGQNAAIGASTSGNYYLYTHRREENALFRVGNSTGKEGWFPDWAITRSNGLTGSEWTGSTHSDRRLKYVGKENTSGLDKIRQLKVFNYTFKKDTKKEPHVGVIAQDLQKIFPNAVKKGADGFLTIRMEDMFYAVINAIKELDAKYQAQEKRINELEKRIEKLEAKAK